MADRTVKVRLQADISDFVTDIGVKAPAAVNKLERAATRANKTLAGVGSSKGLDPIADKADRVSEKLKKTGDSAKTAGEKVRASAKTSTEATQKFSESVTRSERAVTSSSKAVSVASKNADSYASALGRLRVAQLRLAEAQKAGKSGSGLAGAEESVASAERAVKKLETVKKGFFEKGVDAGKSFGTGLKKWLTGSGGLSDIGKSGGTVFGSGFLGVLKTPILGPAVIAILGAAIATALPAVGAAAGGAFVTAFGGGLAGLGLIFAAKSDAVKAKWAATMSQLGADMRLLSRPFESTLVHIADYFERTVDRFNPTLGKAFTALAGPVDTFVDRASRSLENLIPAIDPIVRAFTGVLNALGGALPGAVKTMADGFTRLAESVEKNPQALADTVTGLARIVKATTDFITTLNNINTGFSNLTGGLSLVKLALYGIEGIIAGIAGPFVLLAKSIDLINAALGRTGKDSAGAGKSMSDAANQTALLAQSLGKTGAAANGATGPLKGMGAVTETAAEKAAKAKAATEGWISSLFQLQNLALTLSGAQISYQAAIDATTASIKENGRTHDINTAKGRANKSALDAVAKAAIDQTEAMLRSGKGNAAAGKAAEASRANFIKLATQMGYTVPQAKAMADSMFKIPNVLRTAKLEGDKKDLDSKLAAARKALADPKLTATKKAKLQAEIKQLLTAKQQAQAAIDSLHGKTVTITYTAKGVNLTAPSRVGGHADGGQLGGKSPNPRADNLLFMGTAGEWVQPNASVDEYGPGFMQAVQTRKFPKELAQGYKDGGQLGYAGKRADGGFLPGGKLVDIAFLLKQLGIPFNPSAGVNYGNTLAAQNNALGLVGSAKTAASSADRTEASAKADVARLQRAITLQQRYVAQLRREGASKSRIAAESKETIGLQDQLYRAKLKLTAATTASNKADATLKQRQDAAAAATAAHKDAIEKLIAQQQAAVDMAAQIADSLTGGANIGDLFQNSLTGKGLLQDLQGQGVALGKFGGQANQLRKLGLSEDLIQQLVGKGAETGGEVAQAIIDGGAALVAALNKAQKNLDDQANLIGAGSANKKYGQTISDARAGGGPTSPNKAYVVGEDGPEILRMGGKGGWVEPNQATDPRRYITAGGGLGGGTATVVHEHQYHQTIVNNGVSMAEADLIANRSISKLRLLGRR